MGRIVRFFITVLIIIGAYFYGKHEGSMQYEDPNYESSSSIIIKKIKNYVASYFSENNSTGVSSAKNHFSKAGKYISGYLDNYNSNNYVNNNKNNNENNNTSRNSATTEESWLYY